MNALMRRRGMMQRTRNIDCPYITDGLIFWLDGIQRGGVAGRWVDLISGKTFELHNCSENADGVVFAGSTSSYADYNGAISSNWTTETLELATSSAVFKNSTLLCPAKIGTVGIGLICSSSSENAWMNLDGTNANGLALSDGIVTKTLSANKNGCVKNGGIVSNSGRDSWGANTSTITYVGVRRTGSATLSKPFKGTLHSLRIYNRLLTTDEMKFNQHVDEERFNL